MAGQDDILSRSYDVFISYDHENEKETDAAQRLGNALTAAGFSVWWDRQMQTGDDWRRTLIVKLRAARHVVGLITQRSVSREWCRIEWLEARTDRKFSAIEIEPGAIALTKGDASLDLAADVYQQLEPRDDDFCARVIEKLPIQPSHEAKGGLVDENIRQALDNLPPPPSALIGRSAEMRMLRDAWAAPETTMVVLHAIGGAGKTALSATFAEEMTRVGSSARAVYGWSAYSQGAGEQRNTDTDKFIREALAWFGADADSGDTVTKARRLAEVVAKERAVLIVDGVEPLQYPPKIKGGALKDKPLAALLKGLARKNNGLCVVTSRQPLPELAEFKTVANRPLDELATEDGAALLKHLGVVGRPKELDAAVTELLGHALSLNLLGTYLNATAGGDVTKRREFAFDKMIGDPSLLQLTDETEKLAARANKVMRGYLEHLQALKEEGAASGGAFERAILHILGLFDRPADEKAVRALLAQPGIDGLTSELFVDVEMTDQGVDFETISTKSFAKRWRDAKERLAALKLIAAPVTGEPYAIDAHPVVRKYFADRLREAEPDAWREANRRLYEHYKTAAPALPETLEEMQPLIWACAHGVAAGDVLAAFFDVYQKRINRDFFISHKLGAHGADLSALAAFFQEPWTTPRPELADGRGADSAVLGYTAFSLRALGRLRDSVAPMRAGLELREQSEDWRNAAIAATNLSGSLLAIGDVAASVAAAETAVAHADRSDDALWRFLIRTTLADAKAQAGDAGAARALFEEAEAMQARKDPEDPKLYSLGGYRFADLLLDEGAAEEVLERSADALKISMRNNLLLDIGLDHLSAGRAHALLATAPAGMLDRLLRRGPSSRTTEHAKKAAEALNEAVSWLRTAGDDSFIAHGLTARAGYRRWRFEALRDADARLGAIEDLDEAQEIAEFGEMKLLLCDIALERCRLALADKDKKAARAQLETAAQLVKQTGYGRRREDLKALRRRC